MRECNQETYDKIVQGDLLEQRQRETYHTLFYCGPISPTALDRMAATQFSSDTGDVWSRQIPKMFGLKLLVWIGKKVCPHSGIEEDVWDVTPTLPQVRDATRDEAPPPPTTPLRDNKPTKKKLAEAVEYITMAVKFMSADEGKEPPESVQHTLRWMRKPITRKRKSSA